TGEIAVKLIEHRAPFRERLGSVFEVKVRVFPGPAEFNQTLFVEPDTESQAVAWAGVENHFGIGALYVRLKQGAHAGAISNKRRQIEAQRLAGRSRLRYRHP